MKDPAMAVKDMLVAADIGTYAAASGWSIHVAQFPSSPDTVVLVNQTGGTDPMPHLLVNYPSVSILIRGAKANGYVDARTKAQEVTDALLGITSQTINGDIYRSCNQMGDVSYLGQDESERPMFSANFRFIVLSESGTHRQPIT